MPSTNKALHLLFFYSIFAQQCTSSTPTTETWKPATATYTRPSDEWPTLGGACGYGDFGPPTYGMYGAAISGQLFNRGRSCGACFEIRCAEDSLWCRHGGGSSSVVVTATDFCAPNYGKAGDSGGWCNLPNEHFDLSEIAFAVIAETKANCIKVEYRRVKCERRKGGLRFSVSGSGQFVEVLVSNVGLDGEVVGMRVKGRRSGWIPMARNWGQMWHSNFNLKGQPLSFEVTLSSGSRLTSYNVAPATWQFGQTFQGNQF